MQVLPNFMSTVPMVRDVGLMSPGVGAMQMVPSPMVGGGMYPGMMDPAAAPWMVPTPMGLMGSPDSSVGGILPKDPRLLTTTRARRGPKTKSRETIEHSKTNVYISGLKPSTTDENLRDLCDKYGTIVSAKSIIDREQNICKGYGFVMYETEEQARLAIDSLLRKGVQAAFAKISKPSETQSMQNVDPTNLYLTNLPTDYDEDALNAMLMACQAGDVVSCRVLRDENGDSRRVGLARMNSHEACEAIVKRLNGCILPGSVEALRVKYANGPSARKKRSGSREPPDHGGDGDGEFGVSYGDIDASPYGGPMAAPPMAVPPGSHYRAPWAPSMAETVPPTHAMIAPTPAPQTASPVQFGNHVHMAGVASASWSAGTALAQDGFESPKVQPQFTPAKVQDSAPPPVPLSPPRTPKSASEANAASPTPGTPETPAQKAQAASISRVKAYSQGGKNDTTRQAAGYASYMQSGGNISGVQQAKPAE